MTESFKAGAAKVEITPPLGTLINGDFLPHYARWIHDPLYAKALVMQSGTTTIAFVVIDIMSISKELADLIKEDIYQRTGIEKINVLLSATHTHAVVSETDTLLTPVDFANRKKIFELVTTAVLKALKNLHRQRLHMAPRRHLIM